MSVPSITMSNGLNIPIIGLGTWKSPQGQVEQAVKDAIDAGYRHIDCAFVYGNENEVGDGIAVKIAEGVVKREDLFITSKLWNIFHDPKDVKGAVEKSLNRLKLDYLDLYLIHWPMGYANLDNGETLFPKNEKEEWIFSDVDYVDTWKGFEELVDAGLVKSIGLSNFNSKQIERIISSARIQPAMLQIECHPYLNQKRLIDFCRSKNIAVTAYSPLGSNDRPWAKPEDPQLMDQPKIVRIAEKYGKTPAQILIRYQAQRNVAVIPKSVTKSRIISNFDVFNFELSAEDIEAIDSIDCNGRLCALGWVNHHPHYPFAEEF
ncbi:aldo-keto reductase 1B-like [Chironomus tepperi]|uniref:aldo-keto reductase 1B-like n=1 Tax=Chironomus tepperi TaxID=113505 RepID=UPI00391F1477